MKHNKALLSTRTIYARAIYRGLKKFEVRRYSIEAETIYFYEPKPVGLITGYIKIGRPIRMSVEDIIPYERETLLTPNQLERLADGQGYLYLWPIKAAVPTPPMTLATHAPRPYLYLD